MNNEPFEALTIAPRTLLSTLLGRVEMGSQHNWRYRMLFGASGSLLASFMQRLWHHRVGGLVLYALGVRTVRDMERMARRGQRR